MTELKPLGIYRTARRSAPVSVLGYGAGVITTQLTNRRLDSFAAVLILDGYGALTSEKAGQLSVGAHSLFWLFPGELHSYGPAAGTAWQERWILFSGSFCDYFLKSRLIDPARPLVRLTEQTSVSNLFGTVHSAILDDTPLGRATGGMVLHRLVIEVARQQIPAIVPVDGPDADALAATLRARAFETFNFAEFAREHGISAATLRRRFADRFGVSPKAMQLEIRLDRAKQLLAGSDDTIEHIADSVGFSDSFYFSRVFRAREGRSPSEFRLRNNRR